jgi:hypothetical protein
MTFLKQGDTIREETDSEVIAQLYNAGWELWEPPPPQWVGFGAALGADQQVNQFVGSLIQAAPVLHLMVGVGLGQAAQGDPRTFLTAWTMGLQTGLVTPEMAAHVVEVAQPFNLPADFLAELVP